MTRHQFIPSEDNENQMIDALIPLYDMLNHEQGKVSFSRVFLLIVRNNEKIKFLKF